MNHTNGTRACTPGGVGAGRGPGPALTEGPELQSRRTEGLARLAVAPSVASSWPALGACTAEPWSAGLAHRMSAEICPLGVFSSHPAAAAGWTPAALKSENRAGWKASSMELSFSPSLAGFPEGRHQCSPGHRGGKTSWSRINCIPGRRGGGRRLSSMEREVWGGFFQRPALHTCKMGGRAGAPGHTGS